MKLPNTLSVAHPLENQTRHKPEEEIMLELSQHTCRRLASAMQVALQIPEGNALVFLIGRGHEHSNLAALETWVKETLPQLEEECGVAVLPYLVGRLQQAMDQWGAA